MKKYRILVLALAAPLLWRCTSTNRTHEIGATRMLYESPSLSRAETHPHGGPAFKAEAGEKFHRVFTGRTDGFERKGVLFKPQFPGNLQVEQGEQSALLSAAFRFTESADVFVQGEITWGTGISSSAWLLGCRSEMNPEGFTPFLEGGFGMLDVYVHSVIDMYQENNSIVFPSEEREFLGSETIDASRFVPFPHIAAGFRARFGSRMNLFAKARTLYVHDVHTVGISGFMNSAGMEADLEVTRHLSVHAMAELLATTLQESRVSQNVGMGLTYRAW